MKKKSLTSFSYMTKTRWLNLISPMPRAGRLRSGKECDEDSLYRKSNVNEEYLEAFRTKSYMELCNKAQRQLGNAGSTKRLSSSSTSSLPYFMHLTEYLLEPRQETITNMTQSLHVNHLLLNYFEASLEACHYCDTILEAVHQMRLSYQKITRVVKLSKMMLDCTTNTDDVSDQAQKAIYKHLASFALQNNPFSLVSSMQFIDIHNRYTALLHRLKSKAAKIRRRVAFKRICKKVAGIGVVILHSALLITLLVLTFHSIAGIVATPSIMVGLVSLFSKRSKWVKMKRVVNASYFERVGEQLDVAAKGIYILINDFDTMSRMVKRLQDEVEHQQTVADMCLKNGKCEILKQVLKEFHDQESSFLAQLEELEEHIYLCFLTINRSRQLVIQEIMKKQR